MREAWTLQDIYHFIGELDEETGLNIAENMVSINNALKLTYGRVVVMTCGGLKYISKIEFSPDLIKYGSDEQIKECIIHEYAHCMQVVKGIKIGHNASFRVYAKQLGGTGKTHFDEELAFRPHEEKEELAFQSHEEKEMIKAKTLPVKYKVKCQRCETVFSYKRKTKLIHCLMGNKAHDYICSCGSEELKIIENRE